jgi:hypothetical protein
MTVRLTAAWASAYTRSFEDPPNCSEREDDRSPWYLLGGPSGVKGRRLPEGVASGLLPLEAEFQ